MDPATYLQLHLAHPPKLSWRGKILLSLILLFVAYWVGFAVYIVSMPKPFTTVPDNVKGLAVLTGGSGRVDAALTQLYHGFGGPILISGRHPRTRLSDILAESTYSFSRVQRAQIALDAAQTTHENIQSVQIWARDHNISHIGIITSTYHAARVKLLAYWLAPQLSVELLPVQPADSGIKPLFKEYNKLLGTPFLP